MDKYLMVMLGAGFGGLARYVVGAELSRRLGGSFPYGTLAVNVTGSFLIGFVMTFFTGRGQLDPNARLLLVVGFLGGFTTFSSLTYETFQLMRGGGHWPAAVNVAANFILGGMALLFGVMLAARR